MEDTRIVYKFSLESGEKVTHTIVLDGKTLALKSSEPASTASWTKLDNHQCDVCPLASATTPHCPIAQNLHSLSETFKHHVSHDDVRVVIQTKERSYYKKTAMENGLFSIFGIIMSTSGCPVMKFLKPMAKFHLPFASMEETIVRSTSFYLLRQYFGKQKGKEFDTDFRGLDEHYKQVMSVNMGISSRLRHITEGDADRNAVVILSSFGQMIQISLNEKLADLSYLFDDDDDDDEVESE